jgi:hypothetical protein
LNFKNFKKFQLTYKNLRSNENVWFCKILKKKNHQVWSLYEGEIPELFRVGPHVDHALVAPHVGPSASGVHMWDQALVGPHVGPCAGGPRTWDYAFMGPACGTQCWWGPNVGPQWWVHVDM